MLDFILKMLKPLVIFVDFYDSLCEKTMKHNDFFGTVTIYVGLGSMAVSILGIWTPPIGANNEWVFYPALTNITYIPVLIIWNIRAKRKRMVDEIIKKALRE